MGFFYNLKSLFSKNIECSRELEGKFFHLFRKGASRVHFNHNIIVPHGFVAVFVYRDRVCDVVESGKHKICATVMPMFFKRIKGVFAPKKFKLLKSVVADVYFLNITKQSNFTFFSNQPFYLRDEKFGKVKGNAEGVCDFVVEDAKALMVTLLKNYAVLKNERALFELKTWLGNAVTNSLEKSKIGFSDLLTKNEMVNDFLFDRLQHYFSDVGISLSKINLHAFLFDKKLQKQVAEYLIDYKVKDNNFFAQSEVVFEEMTVDRQVKLSENKVEKNTSSDTVCDNCGARVSAVFNYCPNCSNKLR